jgi:NADP-dependent aldehyde dehydrogenase
VRTFRAVNPTTGERFEPAFQAASDSDVDEAARLAQEAFVVYSRRSGKKRGEFLRLIAKELESSGEDLVKRATQETALPAGRIQSEIGRTCNQLYLFAQVVEEGSWVQARIDHADAERKPLPKPDVRSMYVALGPVAVFGASNFPIAFSVAGGDTASALAAGNPVIVKAHPAHPGTSELAGAAIARAVAKAGLPPGTFSLLFDDGVEVGKALVKHPSIKAVGFTGSHAGGRALMDLAAARPEPIPVYAEMGSINPVFVLPGAMKERRDQIAAGLHASVTLGAGQFCTKPGVVMLADDDSAQAFAAKLGELVSATPASALLTAGIHAAYCAGVSTRSGGGRAKLVGKGTTADVGHSAAAAVFETDAKAFASDPMLGAELFGPATLLVRYNKRDELLSLARSLHGHLTATLHATEDDLREYADLVQVLTTKVGRLVLNGYPTGVEVCHAMVHGGPYPATSDGRSTSVGTHAIFRFARLVCWQGFPDAALPEELQQKNPLGIWRLVDGELAR